MPRPMAAPMAAPAALTAALSAWPSLARYAPMAAPAARPPAAPMAVPTILPVLELFCLVPTVAISGRGMVTSPFFVWTVMASGVEAVNWPWSSLPVLRATSMASPFFRAARLSHGVRSFACADRTRATMSAGTRASCLIVRELREPLRRGLRASPCRRFW